MPAVLGEGCPSGCVRTLWPAALTATPRTAGVTPHWAAPAPLAVRAPRQARPAARLGAAAGAGPAAEEAQRYRPPLGEAGDALAGDTLSAGASPASAAEAAVLESGGGGSAAAGGCPIKSLLFLADGAPLLVVLPMGARVAEAKLATYLRLPRRK